ncbi:hypothetical protein ACOME3_003461 [Neoechinorhynchus agilis]
MPPPKTPPPLILRERPPNPPPYIPPQVILKKLPARSPPPRQVIIERFPPCPPKPRDIVIERWLPYDTYQKREIIYERCQDVPLCKPPKNMVIAYEQTKNPTVIKRCVSHAGITRMEPEYYLNKYGNAILSKDDILRRVNSEGVADDIAKADSVIIGKRRRHQSESVPYSHDSLNSKPQVSSEFINEPDFTSWDIANLDETTSGVEKPCCDDSNPIYKEITLIPNGTKRDQGVEIGTAKNDGMSSTSDIDNLRLGTYCCTTSFDSLDHTDFPNRPNVSYPFVPTDNDFCYENKANMLYSRATTVYLPNSHTNPEICSLQDEQQIARYDHLMLGKDIGETIRRRQRHISIGDFDFGIIGNETKEQQTVNNALSQENAKLEEI